MRVDVVIITPYKTKYESKNQNYTFPGHDSYFSIIYSDKVILRWATVTVKSRADVIILCFLSYSLSKFIWIVRYSRQEAFA